MGIELSIVYLLSVCAMTAGFWALLIRVANPRRPRLNEKDHIRNIYHAVMVGVSLG